MLAIDAGGCGTAPLAPPGGGTACAHHYGPRRSLARARMARQRLGCAGHGPRRRPLWPIRHPCGALPVLRNGRREHRGSCLCGRGPARVGVSSRPVTKPTPLQLAVGFGTNFFDTLGIGSFAPTTAVFRARRMVDDALIPGTLNVG